MPSNGVNSGVNSVDSSINSGVSSNSNQTRDDLVTRLRSVLGWISTRDHSIAIDLDSIVNDLESLAVEDIRVQLVIVTRERDAAMADLYRIYKIVKNPMGEYTDRIKGLNDKAITSSIEIDEGLEKLTSEAGGNADRFRDITPNAS